MSLYEMHFVTNAAEQARLKEQRKILLKALKELSINVKLQQQQEVDKVLTRPYLATSQLHDSNHKTPLGLDIWYNNTPVTEVATECRPYTPYNQTTRENSNTYYNNKYPGSPASSSASSMSLLLRHRTPSMSSTISSINSDNTSCIYENDKENNHLEISERDEYGFKRPLQWVTAAQLHKFEIKYQIKLLKQSKSWNKLISNNDRQWPKLCPELTPFVRNGIPQKLRMKAWMHYSGAEKRMKENTGIYQSLVEKAEALDKANEFADVIKRDLHRTFPDNVYFACEVKGKDGNVTNEPESNEKLQMMRRVLLAFSIHSPDIGYCQSLNFLAGFLLIFGKEEEAFWMLVTMIEDYFPKSMFDKTMEGANIEQTVLMMMVYEKMPGVWSKIADKKCFWECEQNESLPPITLVTSHWFLTLFINILPVETVLRILDCFFVGEGFKVLYQVALTIIKLNEQAIWNASESVETFQILQNMPRRLIDCHEFLKSVFSNNGIAFDVNIQEIDRKRDLFRNRKSQRKQQLEL